MNSKYKNVILNLLAIIFGCYLFQDGSTGIGLFCISINSVLMNQNINEIKF